MGDQERTEVAPETATLAADDPAAVAAERDQAVQEKAELQDLLQRRQAEFENYRRRAERERIEIAEYAAMETVRPLLGIIDDFERALKVGGGTDEFVKGVELIYTRLLDELKKQGLEAIDTVGQVFDPNLHHAIQRAETADAEEGAILEEYQKGYNFKGRLLRPAMVKVAVHAE